MKIFLFFGFSVLLQLLNAASAYELKNIMVDGYSKPWLIVRAGGVVPSKITEGRIHFHGWTQDPATGAPVNAKYDFAWKDATKTPSESDLRKFVEAYGMQREVESRPERAIFIPLARGHNDQYPELDNVDTFEVVFSRVLKAMDIDENQFTLLTTSAHSGGGELMATLLSAADQVRYLRDVSRAIFYDAMYSDETQANAQRWVDLRMPDTLKRLDMVCIPGQSPISRARQIMESYSMGEAVQVLDVDGARLNWRMKHSFSQNLVSLIEEQNDRGIFDHWSIVKGLWQF